MRTKGIINSWNDEKGYGFIKPSYGGKQVFIHIKAFSNRNRRPEINQLVTYVLSSDKQGRPCAIRASLAGDRLSDKIKRKKDIFPIVTAVFFLAIVSISVLIGKLPPLILAIYLSVSLLTFIVYLLDKSAAKKGAWRTQESTLHLLSLAGGWPGALIAQSKLRHKTKKQPFRSVFWVTVILNIGVLFWLFTHSGSAILHSLVSHIV